MYPRLILFFLLFLTGITPALALPAPKPQVIFMHAFKEGDFLEKKLSALVERYNARPSAPAQVILLPGGDYTQSFTRLLKGEITPHIAMVSEYNSVTMFTSPHLYVPLGDILDVRKLNFLAPIREFYSFEGKMVSYPFNCSAPALYYNREAFKKAGLPEAPPQTWEEILIYCQKLQNVGIGGFTFAWPAAYALEHFAAIHNIPFATYQNGFKNPAKARLRLKDPRFFSQLTFLQDAVKKGIFSMAATVLRMPRNSSLRARSQSSCKGQIVIASLNRKSPRFQLGWALIPIKRPSPASPTP